MRKVKNIQPQQEKHFSYKKRVYFFVRKNTISSYLKNLFTNLTSLKLGQATAATLLINILLCEMIPLIHSVPRDPEMGHH